MQEEIPPINREEIEAVLAYIPTLSDAGFSFGEWRTHEGQFPQYVFSAEADKFIKALSKLIVVFDWPAWKEKASIIMEDPGALAKADLLALRRLITTHLRAERFNEGHLAAQFESGHLLGILKRLKEIQAQS
jgi:hypothetical protein